MPIIGEIRRKEPKSDWDRPKHYLVVNGPAHLFSKAMERFMFMQGMNAMNGEDEHVVWSGRPTIGPAPIYLASLLKYKYGIELKKPSQRMVDLAVEPFEDSDGLEHFIGRSKKRNDGTGPLEIRAGSVDFIANCTEENWARREFIEGAGWLPLKNITPEIRARFGSRPYTTRDPIIAGNLEHFMTPSAKQKLNQRLSLYMDNMKRSQSQEAPEDFDIPSPDGLEYLDFQKGGIKQVIDENGGAIIADDMGLGKTIQGIGVLNGSPHVRRAIFFCQANMRLKWVREIEKWKINPDLTVDHAEGSHFPDSDIVVINYDIAMKNIDKIRAVDWDLVVTDEAHSLKNPDSQRTRAILGDLDSFEGLGPIPMSDCGKLVHLTGTPKPNRISDLWPLLTTSRPDIWGSGPEARQAFVDRYEPPRLIKRQVSPKRPGDKPYEIIVPMPGDPLRELELQMRMRGSGSFIRRLKRDTDMPPKTRTPIEMPFKLSKEDQETLKQVEADLYEISNRIRNRPLKKGKQEVAREVIDIISGIAPGSPEFTEYARVRKNLGILKAPHAARFIIEELKDDKDLSVEQRRKTVVFAHHKEVISTIANMARKEFPNGVIVYDGSSGSAAKRQALIDRFQEDPEARLFIMSLAGATGITLTSACRMRVVEPDWLPSNIIQIEDRIWRIGQKEACDIGYLFVPNSLDINMGLALHAKTETDERALNTMSMRGMVVTKNQSDNKNDTLSPEQGDAAKEAKRKRKDKADDLQPELPL